MIVAQISDPHLTHDTDSSAAMHLRRAVAHILALPVSPDVVLVTGDCVNNGQPAEYALFQAIIRVLPMPVYVIPGNHDDRQHMLARFGTQGLAPLDGFVQYVVDVGPLRLIALDTHVPGGDGGALCAKRLEWLDARLTEASNRPTLIFMHHPPLRMGLDVIDDIKLADAEVFADIIVRHAQVERIATGHVHMALTQRFTRTVVMSCPSTAHTMLPDLSRPNQVNVLMEPPACLLHIWNETTGLLSYTSHIGDPKPLTLRHDGVQWLP